MKIKIPEKDFKFLKNLADKLEKQDNRGTANPKFYQIKTKRRIFGIEIDCTNEYVYMAEDDPELYFNTIEELDIHLREYIGKEYIEDSKKVSKEDEESLECWGFEKVGYIEIDEYENCFLTEDAIKQHIHSYSYNYKEPTSYLFYAKKNPEMKQLINTILKIGKLND